MSTEIRRFPLTLPSFERCPQMAGQNGKRRAYVARRMIAESCVQEWPLMPELYEHLNPMPFEAAAQMEIELAEDLRVQCYTVTGGR